MNRTKFMAAIISLTLLTAIFSACGKDALPVVTPTQTPGPVIPSETPTAIPETISGTVEITENSVQKTYTADDGTVVLNLSVSVPEIENPEQSQAISMINDYYAEEMADHLAYAEAILSYTAKNSFEETKDSDSEFMPFSTTQEFTVHYNKDGKLSISRLYSDFTGFSDGELVLKAQTFDTINGGQIIAGDLFALSEEVYSEHIIAEIIRQAQKNADVSAYNEDYEEIIRASFQKDNFYLTDSGVVFYYQMHTISSSGICTFEIPYSTLTDLLR